MKRLRFVLLLLLLSLCASVFIACGSIGIDFEKDGFTAKVLFDFQGGNFTVKNNAIEGDFGYVLKPGSLLPNPAKMEGNILWRDGYDYDVDSDSDVIWYKDKECTQPWNFKTDKVQSGVITLYVKWIEQIRHTYTFYYKDADGSLQAKYSYRISTEHEKLRAPTDINLLRDGYTLELAANRFWKDENCTVPWDNDFEHPGGEEDSDVPVYVKYIEGVWDLVTDAASLKDAFDGDRNIYLINDIDFGGEEWNVRNYSGELRGENKRIYNFKKTLNRLQGMSAVIERLNGGANVHDVTFEEIQFIVPKDSTYTSFKVAALAISANAETDKTITVSNVTVKGKFVLGSNARIADTTDTSNIKYEPLSESYIAEGLKKAVCDETNAQITNFVSELVLEIAE